VDVDRVTDAEELLGRAGPLLLADEPRHNLALGILSVVRDHPEVHPELEGWVVRDGTRVVGAALRTPPMNLVLAQPLESRALDALARAIPVDLPGVVGAVPEVDGFAGAWGAGRAVTVTVRFEQRIYALRTVVQPDVAGEMRLAGGADLELVLAWVHAFSDEALHDGDGDTARIERSIDARLAGTGPGGIALWEVGGRPVSLAGFGSPTPTGIRIGPVYTPLEHRGRGYGSAVTAAASQLQLERGRQVCFLYTDLSNPTSNAIYLRIGYEPVCDSRELVFSAPGSSPGAAVDDVLHARDGRAAVRRAGRSRRRQPPDG
jgi:GNAT superfamily N-acetyltransferase